EVLPWIRDSTRGCAVARDYTTIVGFVAGRSAMEVYAVRGSPGTRSESSPPPDQLSPGTGRDRHDSLPSHGRVDRSRDARSARPAPGPRPGTVPGAVVA